MKNIITIICLLFAIGLTAQDLSLTNGVRSVEDPSNKGVEQSNVFTYGLFGSYSTTDYHHIQVELDTAVASHNHMFLFNVKGYGYAASEIIDIDYGGYFYSANNTLLAQIINNNSSSNVTDELMYIGTNGKLYLRFKLNNTGYTGFRINSFNIGNGKSYTSDEFTVTQSPTIQL